MKSSYVIAGVSVIIRKDEFVLMGLRKGSHGAGCWAFPGGHMEPGESVAQAGSRELLEETGINIPPDDFRKLTYTNDYFAREEKHYITLYLETLWDGQEPKIMEPEKCAEWMWTRHEPGALFLPIRNLLKEPGGRDYIWPRRRECDHPWHDNPGLITPCPQCGEGKDE